MPPFLDRVTGTIAQARPELVLLALVLHIVGLIVAGERWRLLLVSTGAPVSLTRAALVNLAGIFVRNVTPASGLGGDAVRIGLFKAAGASLRNATVIFLVVRLVEVPAIVGMVLLAIPLIGPLSHSTRWLVMLAGGLGTAVVAVYALRGGRASRWIGTHEAQAARVRIPRSVIERAITYLFSTAAGAAALVAIGGWDLIGRRQRRILSETSALEPTLASETSEQ
jgi:uncharacterized membrane protein YbhN (UPF0104 family)